MFYNQLSSLKDNIEDQTLLVFLFNIYNLIQLG